MRFLNDDVAIEAGARTAIKKPAKQLARFMYNRAKSLTDSPEIFTQFTGFDLFCEAENAVYCVAETLLEFHPAISQDNRYNVRTYHCTTAITDFGADVGEPLGGFHTIGDLTFFGFFAGDAWDYATFMIIYPDGDNLRLYTPIRGNFVNTDYNTVLGRECDTSDEDILTSFGLLESDTQTLADIYVQKYGYEKMDLEKVGFNWDAIKEDIKTAIKVM
jgi:hypothetical protein